MEARPEALDHGSGSRPLAARYGPAWITAAVGAALLWWSWGTWPDPVVDFGRELYVPWQLSKGKVLYRDIAFHDGPLSPYVNAFCFRILGVSLRSLVLLNCAVLAASVALVFALVSAISRRGLAFGSCLIFLTVFAFGQYTQAGNYNWLCPYSHALTHGVALSMASLFFLAKFQRNGSQRWLLASGAAVGLLFLTKVEVFVAGAVASAALLGLGLWSRGELAIGRAAVGRCLTWLGAALMPALSSMVLLGLAMPPGAAVAGTLGSLRHVFGHGLAAQRFFLENAGLFDPAASARTLGIWSLGYLTCIGGFTALSFAARSHVRAGSIAAPSLLLVGFAGLASRLQWGEVARPWPLFMLWLFAMTWRRLGSTRDPAQREVLIIRLGVTVFAWLLLLKMLLRTSIGHYGFGLALPATWLCLVASLDFIPAFIDRHGGAGRVFKAGALSAWALLVGVHLLWSSVSLHRKSYELGTGANAFLADQRGQVVAGALRVLASAVPAGRTLTCLPDCEMLNFLSGLDNPQRFGNFNPHQVATFGEAAMLQSLRAHPPDFVALVHADTSEYGPRFFGKDYGLWLYSWIRDHYTPIGQVGSPPMVRSDRFGILLLRRRAAASPGFAQHRAEGEHADRP